MNIDENVRKALAEGGLRSIVVYSDNDSQEDPALIEVCARRQWGGGGQIYLWGPNRADSPRIPAKRGLFRITLIIEEVPVDEQVFEKLTRDNWNSKYQKV